MLITLSVPLKIRWCIWTDDFPAILVCHLQINMEVHSILLQSTNEEYSCMQIVLAYLWKKYNVLYDYIDHRKQIKVFFMQVGFWWHDKLNHIVYCYYYSLNILSWVFFFLPNHSDIERAYYTSVMDVFFTWT